MNVDWLFIIGFCLLLVVMILSIVYYIITIFDNKKDDKKDDNKYLYNNIIPPLNGNNIILFADKNENGKYNNKILEIGEIFFENDTRKFRIGDGKTKFKNLPIIDYDELVWNPENDCLSLHDLDILMNKDRGEYMTITGGKE